MPPSRTVRAELRWQWSEFGALSPGDVYEMLALRERVFIVEQNCAYQDADGRDSSARHLLGWDDSGSTPVLVAYARVFAPGVRYKEASIGRIVTAPEVRRRRMGRLLVEEALRRCGGEFSGSVRIAAQRRLEKFYEGFGFVVDGEPYLEDGIEHIDMIGTAD
jgi:ElaA protein